jgi:hypothetical protein
LRDRPFFAVDVGGSSVKSALIVDAKCGTVRYAANLPLRETPLPELLAAVTSHRASS